MSAAIKPWEVGWLRSHTRKLTRGAWLIGAMLLIIAYILEKTHLMLPETTWGLRVFSVALANLGIFSNLYFWNRRTLQDYRQMQIPALKAQENTNSAATAVNNHQPAQPQEKPFRGMLLTYPWFGTVALPLNFAVMGIGLGQGWIKVARGDDSAWFPIKMAAFCLACFVFIQYLVVYMNQRYVTSIENENQTLKAELSALKNTQSS